MTSQLNARVRSGLRVYVNVASFFVLGVGLIVIGGWFFGIPGLKSLLFDLPAMRFNTALSLSHLSGSLLLLKNEEAGTVRIRLGQSLAGLVLLLSLLSLSEYLFHVNLGIDEFFVKDLDSTPDLFPGRMAPLAILLVGLSSICLLKLGSRTSQSLAFVIAGFSLLIILNYQFDFQVFNKIPAYGLIAAHTGVAFLVFALAIIAARPTPEFMEVFFSNLPGSRAMCILLPAIIALTIVMGWLVEQGQNLGLLDPSKESVLLVILLIFVYFPLVYFIAKSVNKTESRLLLSDQILQRVNALVLVANRQGSILYVSPAVKTILGFEPAELLGEGWWKVSRSNADDGQAEKQRILSSTSPQEKISPVPYEREIRDRWGNTHWIMWVDALGPDSTIIGVGHDVTERKHAEQELRENEFRYRQAIMAVNAIPYSLDYAARRYTFIGEGITKLTGYAPDEMNPELLDSLIVESIMQGSFKSLSRSDAIERVRQGKSGLLWQCDYRIYTRSGEERWVSDASIQVLDEEDAPTGSIGILQDITDRVKSEQALRQSERELRALSGLLEQRVIERTQDLNRVNAELERAARAKDEFLAVMSHELRTPLNSILGLSELLLEQARGPLNEYQQKLLRIIDSSGQHLLSLINDILDLSKIEAGKLELHPETVEVSKLCENSLAFVKELAMKKSIALAFEPGQAESMISGDPRYLKQILVNLLTNAVKFTPAHGRVVLAVTADAERELLKFSVRDTGIGISPENLSRLFQPFVQVDSKLNRQYEGTGLGLALVQRLTDLHGGSVQVESEVGRGSCFTINLPWQPDLAPQPGLAEEQTELPGGGEVSIKPAQRGRILLVEDNPANVLTIGEYLESRNYSVAVAHNGLEAVAQAFELNPDIILMDIQMPVMDGLEATRRLRADSRFASTPIIALTALAMPDDRERCLEAGASEYVSKPVNLKGLVQMIERLTGQGEKDAF